MGPLPMCRVMAMRCRIWCWVQMARGVQQELRVFWSQCETLQRQYMVNNWWDVMGPISMCRIWQWDA